MPSYRTRFRATWDNGISLSRDTGRWIIPKGNINNRVTPAQAAQKEAYEEAGVKGTITSSIPLGFYTYFKILASGEAQP